MSHPDLIIATRADAALAPLTTDELTVLAEALDEYARRMPAGSGRRIITDALRNRVALLLL